MSEQHFIKSSMIQDKDLILVKDAILYWCDIEEAQPKWGSTSGETEFSVKCIVTEEVVNQFEDINVNKEFFELKAEYRKEKEKKKYGGYSDLVKEYEEKGITLFLATFAQKGKSAAGKDMFVKKLGPNTKVPFTAKIGNGSIGNFRIHTYEGKGPSAGKLNTNLNAVQCVRWVEYVDTGPRDESDLGDAGFDDYDDDNGPMPNGDQPAKSEVKDDGGDDPFGEL